MARKPQRKEKVEDLQENYLVGISEESIEESAEALGENKVVVAHEEPRYERIVFRNHRDPGHVLEFHYMSKTHPFKQYKLIDGHTYNLPVEVVRNLEGCKTPIEKYRRNKDNIPEIYVAGHRNHFMCERA